jgi:hypothetical protein
LILIIPVDSFQPCLPAKMVRDHIMTVRHKRRKALQTGVNPGDEMERILARPAKYSWESSEPN